MERIDFINNFQVFKENAHVFLVENPNGFYFERGPRVISSYLEDLLTVYVAEHLNNPTNKYYVDKAFSYSIKDIVKTCRPDILVCNDKSKGIAYFDAKTDLGSHKSSFVDFIHQKNDFIDAIRGKVLSTKIQSDSNKNKQDKIEITICQDVFYYIIVGGSWAHSSKYQEKYEKALNVCPNVKLSILVDWTTKKGDSFIEREADFRKFDEFLNGLL